MKWFFKALAIQLIVINLFYSNTAFSAPVASPHPTQTIVIYRDFGHKGDENQVRGVVAAYTRLGNKVEVKEFNLGQEEELKSYVKTINAENQKKPIVLAVGEKTVVPFAQMLPLDGATTVHLCHMVTTNHAGLLDKANFIAAPFHALGDFGKGSSQTKLIPTIGVAHNRQIEGVERVYQEDRDQIPESEAYLGIILAGDAPTPQNEIRFFTKENARELAYYVSGIVKGKHLLIINGPRTGKYNPKTLEEIKTAHRDGQKDEVTQAFVAKLQKLGIKPEQMTLFDFQFGQSTGREMDLVLGAIRATKSILLVPGESTSSISESIDVLPKGAVLVYQNTAMSDVHKAHVRSEIEAGRIQYLPLSYQRYIKEHINSEGRPSNSSAAETIAYALMQ